MVAWKSMFPLILVTALVIFEERISIPSCQIVSRNGLEEDWVDSEELKVMMVANLLLMGSEAGYMNIYFRDSYLSKFFTKSFERLKPDMLIVLGDVSAKGSELSNSNWLSVLHQFQRMLGPFLGLPLHIVLGDRDIGECSEVNANSVNRIASNLPGLDSAGCGAFEFNNISFVSLNAVAMLCGNNDLRFSVEKVIERESSDLQTYSKITTEGTNEPSTLGENFREFGWRENALSSGSGPVLLLHFPLHRTTSNNCGGNTVLKRTAPSPVESEGSKMFGNRGFAGSSPYGLFHTLPPNATEYIFQALKPRIIFSAHSHEFCDHTHTDGTREVTVPAMTWDARDDPGFVVATFGRNRAVTVSQCSLARESHVIMAYVSVIVLLISTFIANRSQSMNSGS